VKASPDINLWTSAEHALEYLRRADSIPHRVEGERALLEFVPSDVTRILDLGSGDGRLLALVKAAHPHAYFTGMDFSPTMLQSLRKRFAADTAFTILEHDFSNTLPVVEPFDAIVSSFAIHHVSHERKHSLYKEIFNLLVPGGIFCNLEHVSSPTIRLHHEFLKRLDVLPEQEDPSNKLLDVETQLQWLREIGFDDVDCHWKWRELALFTGCKPVA
jgi:tRNA (cmo5U34)-methyltransferase